MEKIYYICPWGENRETSWSGTHLSLYNAMCNYYDVQNIDIGWYFNSLTKMLRIIEKILGKIKPDLYPGTLRRNYFNSSRSRYLMKDSIPCIQFEECPEYVGNRAFIYQDISIGAILDMAENNRELFEASNFKDYTVSALKKRKKKQDNYYKSTKGILTMGAWFKSYLINVCDIDPKKVHHVGGGINIDIDRIRPNNKARNKFLFVGKDFERKNGPLVVEAFNQLYQKMPMYELYIIGPKKIDNQFLNNPNIKFIGNVTKDRIIDFYNMCDVFVMPSRFEAYGLVFVEALCCGLPVIGRDAFEMPYIIDDEKTGYLLKDNSPVSLADLMFKAMNNNDMFTEVNNRFEYYINNYSWDAVAQRIAKIILDD